MWLVFLIKLSRYPIVPLILAVMVTRFLKMTQLVSLNLLFSENVRGLWDILNIVCVYIGMVYVFKY